ncbi:MAG: DUF1345 domain-containing protein [Sphingomonas bacterium]|nr:DUF1345 domain-containing protein [Sphingomonas bacterium]
MPSAKTIGNRLAPPRYLLFVTVLAIGWGVGISIFGGPRGVMVGFDIAALAFLISCISLFNDSPKEMRADAKANDANRVMFLGISTVLSLVILVTVGSQLAQKEAFDAVEIALIVGTLLLVWTFGNAIYTLHYAHLYYSGDDGGTDKTGGGTDKTGLDFPGKRAPDYADFCYFAFTLGVALQTSDVCITSPHIRRVVTLHCVAAFFFNLGVLALTINVLGSR